MAISLKNIKELLKKKKAVVPSKEPEEEKKECPEPLRRDLDFILRGEVDLEQFRIPKTESAYYVSEYITENDERFLLDCIDKYD